MADIVTFLFLVAFGFVALTIGLQALLSCTNGRPVYQIRYTSWEHGTYGFQERTLANRRIRVKPIPVPVQVRRLQ